MATPNENIQRKEKPLFGRNRQLQGSLSGAALETKWGPNTGCLGKESYSLTSLKKTEREV